MRGDTEDDLPRILDEAEPDEVIIAIPSAPGSTRARIVRECRTARDPGADPADACSSCCRRAAALARQMREVRVEDVLGREPVHMELERVGAYLAGETVLVTGAGGSIGSELCRQIARVEPHRIVLVDHAEDNLFAIQRELEDERHVPPSMLAAVLADCKEEERMREVFAEHRPIDRLPRRRLQARRPDGGQPGRGGPQQRDRHPRGRARRGRAGACAGSCSSRPTRPSRRRP